MDSMSPLNPKDILQLSEKDKEDKAKAIERIDMYLKMNFMGEPVEYPLEELEEQMRGIVLEDVMNEYRPFWTKVKIVEYKSALFHRGKEGRYIRFEYVSPEEIQRRKERKTRINEEYLKRGIEDSELDKRLIRFLKRAGINQTGELPELTVKKVSSYRGIGTVSVDHIREKLQEYGSDLKEE